MATWRLIAWAVVISLAADRTVAQTGSPALQKELEGIRTTEKLLGEVIETAGLEEPVPFGKFLDEIAGRLAKKGRLTFHIDREAFGNSYAAVAEAPVRLPPVPKRMSVGTALRLALSQQKVDCIYRIDPARVTITTQKRSLGLLHTADYDIRDLVDKAPVSARNSQALRIVQTLIAECNRLPSSAAGSTDPGIQILNGHRLVVRASALVHAQVIDVLTALRRAADLAVIVQAELYEVDEAFHDRLRKAKRVPLDELERQFLEGKAPKNDLFALLAKEKPVQAGDRVKLDNGGTVALLSRYHVVACLPAPEQARKGDQARQTILEGVSFTATIEGSSDRRSVRMRFTEVSAQVEDRQKENVLPLGFHHHFADGPGGQELVPPKEIEAERVFVKETATTRLLEIPDGGAKLVAVQYRPPALATKQRWWVLSITPRIWIEEEERQIRQQAGERR